MATSNFHNKNASRIFAVEAAAEWEYDDLKDNLQSEINSVFYPLQIRDGGRDPEELHSYPSHVLKTITEYKEYQNFEVIVTLKAIVRAGYYSGCNLDWVLDYQIDGTVVDLEYFGDLIGEDTRLNVLRTKQAIKWAEKTANSLIDRLEAIYIAHSIPLVVVACFNNGETIYEKAS